MWLLDLNTWKLENFLGRDVWAEKPYAILSHTWGEEGSEVTFQDMHNLDVARQKIGWWKIQKTCEQAKADGLNHAWVDTCCIDKTSSAELQEAINSMFEYYGRATKCYAPLADISWTASDGFRGDLLSTSRWFSRGWTLQELIAPEEVDFYDREWNLIGTRSELKDKIAKRTRITILLLDRRRKDWHEHSPTPLSPYSKLRERLDFCSVAQRMSWAADRQTTRLEDRAYSLLGLFGIYLPLLYGEGERTFTRLQEEILRTNSRPDLSLLLWEKHDRSEPDFDRTHSLFASTPDAFRTCGSIYFHNTFELMENSVDMVICRAGMKALVHVVPLYVDDHEKADYAALLNCYDTNDVTSTIALKLVSQPSSALADSLSEHNVQGEKAFNATPYAEHEITKHGAQKRTICIDVLDAHQHAILRPIFMAREKSIDRNQDNDMPLKVKLYEEPFVWLRFNSFHRLEPKWTITHAWPRAAWDLNSLTFDCRSTDDNIIDGHVTGSIAFRRPDAIVSRVVVSFTTKLLVGVDVIGDDQIDIENLKFCVQKMVRQHGKASNYHADILPNPRELKPTGDLRAKSIQLYEGSGVYEGASFVVKPEIRTFYGRQLKILQVGYSASLKQFEENFEAKYSRVSVQWDEKLLAEEKIRLENVQRETMRYNQALRDRR